MPATSPFHSVPAFGNEAILEGALKVAADQLGRVAALRRELDQAQDALRAAQSVSMRRRGASGPDGGTPSGESRAAVTLSEASSPTEEVTALLRDAQYGTAAALALAALERAPEDLALLRVARTAFTRVGSITLAARATAALNRLSPSAETARQLAELKARITETSQDWRPTIPGPLEPLTPHSDKRVLHILKLSLPYRQSGYTVRSRYSLEAQRLVGLDPVAVTAYGFPRTVGITDFPPYEEVEDIPYYRLDGPDVRLSSPEYLDEYAMHAAEVVRKVRPAIIHAHSGHRGYESALVGLALGRKFDIPVVYEVRGFFEGTWTSDPRWAEQGELFERRSAIEESCFREAAAVVTLSEGMRAEIHARGVPADKVVAIPNGIDTTAFEPRPRNTALAAELGTAGAFTFGYISNLDHFREGHELLIQATRLLRDTGLNVRCLIVGDGRRREELEAIAQQEGVTSEVVFTGRVPHETVLDYYGLLDAFVVPRVPERAARLVTPLKPFEAMACGIPLVVSDLEALTEIIGNGQRGFIFPAGYADELARTLREVAEAPEEARKIADEARRWVGEERAWSRNGQRYADVYARVLGSR